MKEKKSYFYKFFLNFVLMLIVPLLTIVFIFWQADYVVRNQIFDSASKSLKRYSELFDTTMEDIYNTCMTIFGREECGFYLTYALEDSSRKYIQSYKITDMLKSMSNDKYFDIFAYFHYDDKVISGTKSTLNSDYYYNVYYDQYGEENFKQEFMEVLLCDSKRPTWYVMNSQGEAPFLCAAMRVNKFGKPNSDYTICIVLSPEYIKELYRMGDVDENSAFMIFNEEEELLLCSNTQIKDWYLTKGPSPDGKQSEKWYKEQDYMIQLRESALGEWCYSYTVLSKAFWSILLRLRLFCFGGIVLCVLFSLVMAYRNTVRSYRPIGNLVSLLKTKNQMEYDKSAGTEFDFVTFFLNENERKLKESQGIHREWFLLKLLKGNFENKGEEKAYKDMLSFATERFLVCILSVESMQEDGDDLQTFIIQNVFEELCDECGKGYVVALAKDEYALLVNLTGDIEVLQKALRKGQRFCKQYYQIYLTLGYSEIHEGIKDISQCYKEALEAIRYRYLFGQGGEMTFSQIADRRFQYQPRTESRMYLLLLEFIRNGNNERTAAQFVEDLMETESIYDTTSMDRVDVFRQEVVVTMNKVIAKCGMDEEKFYEMTAELLGQSTLARFKMYMAYLIEEMQKEEEKSEEKTEDDGILEKVKAYIEENYWNTSLSIAMLGEEFKLRGAYLSKAFKEKYNISLLSYITYVRVQQAKKFLSQGNMTILEVGEKSGFLSSQVFIKNFKKIEGITPGKFKDSVEINK